MQRIVIGLETQVPYENRKAVKNFTRFLKEYAPDELIGIGDHLDAPAPARWNRGTAQEFATNLQAEVDRMIQIFEEIRESYDGPFSVHHGNHEARIASYLKKQAPALADLRSLRLENLLEYERLDIRLRQPYEKVAPGWVTTHGDAGSLSRIAGSTALNLAKKWGVSVACGHTHRLGVKSTAAPGFHATKSLWGMETGNFMDAKKASYIKSYAPDWTGGFGILEVIGNRVMPKAVEIQPNGSFAVDGVEYK